MHFPSFSVVAALLLIGFLLLSTGASGFSLTSKRVKDIPYKASTAADFNAERNILDVYRPNRKSDKPFPVVVFIHGGNWNSGSKNIYWFIGRRLAKQGVVAVIINYRLSPAVQVPAMADDCAQAVAWTAAHIAEYGGDPGRIYVMGHSAGGGLAALLATDNTLFSRLGLARNPVRGVILDDPAGINMADYLTKMAYPNDKQYLTSFGTDPAGWRAVSPFYRVQAGAPPMLLYTGENTYPSIIDGTEAFQTKLQTLGVANRYTIMPGKKHVPMVKQLFWKSNLIYQETLSLLETGGIY